MEDIEKARRAIDDWHLGSTSAKHESGGRGPATVSSGRGDRGGASYGTYQLSSRMGTLQEYLNQSRYKEQFEGLSPATSGFDAKWRELASNDPDFGSEQHEFIQRTHYQVQVSRLKGDGIDLSERGRAVQDALWSTSVQFGPGSSLIRRSLDESFGKGADLSSISDQAIVEAIQDYKISHNSSLFRGSKDNWDGLLRRARDEKNELSQLASHEQLLAHEGLLPDWKLSISPPPTKRRAMGGNVVSEVQENLNKLHIPDAQGRPLVADGNAGIRTQQAVESFQRQHGMPVDGKATPQLLAATEIAVSVTEALNSGQQIGREFSAQPNPPPGWAGVPHRASTQAVQTARSAERSAEVAQFDSVRVRMDSTERLRSRQMAQPPVPALASELDREVVVSLQRGLNRLGFTDPRGRPLADDGLQGPNTKAAVSAFQREQGLPVTGMGDPATLSAVNAHVIVASLQGQRQEREAQRAFQQAAQTFDSQDAEPRLRHHDPLGRETATLHAQRSSTASHLDELRVRYAPTSVASPVVDVVRPSGRAADTPDHTTTRDVVAGAEGFDLHRATFTSPQPQDARDPRHPDHAFYRAIADKLPNAYAQAGLVAPGHDVQERVAASLSAQARSQGVVSADHVVIGGGGEGNIFVVDGRLDDPAHLRTHLSLQQAQQAPVEPSFQQLQQASQQLDAGKHIQQQQEQQRAHGAGMSM